MCGIAGIYGSGYIKANHSEVIDSLKHRGPDEFGTFIHDQCKLFSTRYKVTGIKGGQQPFYSSDKNIVAIYNGQIYNFIEIKRQLQSIGYHFVTKCDGEVIPAMYQEYGVDFPSKINGEFSIAIYDRTKNQLVLAIDRFGIRPLYFSKCNERIVFASEVKGILSLEPSLKKIDKDKIHSCLLLGYPATGSVFSNIESFPKATTRLYNNHMDFIDHQYWNLKKYIIGEKNTKDGEDELYEQICRSVELRSKSDLPVGVFLSEGIDSALITLIASNVGNISSSFTLNFELNHSNERQNASLLANKLNIDHDILTHKDMDILSSFEDMLYYLEYPIITSGSMAFRNLAKFAKTKVGVALGGEGGDEIFHGYGFHQALETINLVKKDPTYHFDLDQMFDLSERHKSVIKDLYGRLSIATLHGITNGLNNIEITNQFIDSDPFSVSEEYFRNFRLIANDMNEMEYSTYVDFELWLQNHLLVANGDRPSMSIPLEVRYPYLDHNVVEKSLALPYSCHFNALDKKLYQKRKIKGKFSFEFKNPKKSFLSPLARIFHKNPKHPKTEYLKQFLKKEAILNTGYFSPELVQLVEKKGLQEIEWLFLQNLYNPEHERQRFIRPDFGHFIPVVG